MTGVHAVYESVSIRKFLAAVRKLPKDKDVHDPKKWYLTQHQHWIGWLSEYGGPGAYGRTATKRDAKFAYNDIVEPKMLLYLATAVGVDKKKLASARKAAAIGSLMQQSGSIRRVIPWEVVAQHMWPTSSA